MSAFSSIPGELQAMLRDMPLELHAALLELVVVYHGLKPVMRVTARTHQVANLTSWLAQRNFIFLLRRQDVDSATFAQVAPARRHVADDVLWQLFIARSEHALDALAAALTSPTSYADIGRALGYPICCTNWAARTDKVKHDDHGERQTNLIAAAMTRTQHFAGECNILLRDCAFARFPTSAISHYPCRFDCAESVKQAKAYMSCLNRHSPGASVYLRRLLTNVQLWWSDVQWPVTFANETPGMLLQQSDAESIKGAYFVALSGNCGTPGGNIPEDGALQDFGVTRLLLRSSGKLHSIDLTASGVPHVLRWC